MKTIPLTKGQAAIVDDADFARLSQFKWYAQSDRDTKRFYATRKEEGRTALMHREVLSTPPGVLTDHRSHDTLDNRKANLRRCTNSQNQMNRSRPSKNCRSGALGVAWHKKSQKWHPQIKVAGKKIHLGLFAAKSDAITARVAAGKKYFGEFSGLD